MSKRRRRKNSGRPQTPVSDACAVTEAVEVTEAVQESVPQEQTEETANPVIVPEENGAEQSAAPAEAEIAEETEAVPDAPENTSEQEASSVDGEAPAIEKEATAVKAEAPVSEEGQAQDDVPQEETGKAEPPQEEDLPAESDAETEKPAEQEAEKKKKKKKLPKWQRKLIHLIVKIVVIAAIGMSLWHWVGNIYITHDNNMYPHVKDGDLVITYKLGGYYNSDVVVYETDSGRRVGRIIAKEGDVVLIQEDGLFLVNGSTPYENIYYTTLPAAEDGIEYPYTVPEGECFILNDMRDTTNDSRVNGGVPMENLCGKVQIIVRHRGM